MSKRLLISDANILIDMEAGNLIEQMFELDYEYVTPDILFSEELGEQHPHLIGHGLQILPLSGDSVEILIELVQKYNTIGVSSNDLSTLALAKQEAAPLLTGDRILREICLFEKQEVYGALWIVGEMIGDTIISVERAETAYQAMIDDGSRLPQDLIDEQLNKFKNIQK